MVAQAQLAESNNNGNNTNQLPKVIECDIPEGISIQANAYGHGLFAGKDFKQGDILFITSCLFVPDLFGKVILRNRKDGKEYELDMETHSVVQSDTGMRQLYTFDAFMNHSCEPNTESFVTAVREEVIEYDMRAIRPIHRGEELTCDYFLFEYDAGSASIMDCQCGASSCLGKIVGFKYLSFEDAAPRFGSAEPYVIASYLEDHPEIYFLDLQNKVPECIQISLLSLEEGEVNGSNGDGRINSEEELAKENESKKKKTSKRITKMIAQQSFAEDEVVFEDHIVVVDTKRYRGLVVAIAHGQSWGLPDIGTEEEVEGEKVVDRQIWPLARLMTTRDSSAANVRLEVIKMEKGGGGLKGYRAVAMEAIGAGDELCCSHLENDGMIS